MRGLDLIRELEGELERLIHFELALATIFRSDTCVTTVDLRNLHEALRVGQIAERVPWCSIAAMGRSRFHVTSRVPVRVVCGARVETGKLSECLLRLSDRVSYCQN